MPYMLVCLDLSITLEFKLRFGIDLRKNILKSRLMFIMIKPFEDFAVKRKIHNFMH